MRAVRRGRSGRLALGRGCSRSESFGIDLRRGIAEDAGFDRFEQKLAFGHKQNERNLGLEKRTPAQAAARQDFPKSLCRKCNAEMAIRFPKKSAHFPIFSTFGIATAQTLQTKKFIRAPCPPPAGHAPNQPMNHRIFLCTALLPAFAAIGQTGPDDDGRHLPKTAPVPQSAEEENVVTLFSDSARRIAPATRTFGKKTAVSIPADFAPWWIRGQGNTLGGGDSSQGITLENLYVRAITHSTQIKVFSNLPLIRETGITEAAGAFDTNAFLSAQFDHTNDPVGSTLTTGRQGRFKQDQWSFEGGFRKKIITGAEVSLSQELTRTDNNSIYFTPNPQARASLKLEVVQPLLRGAGVTYNRSIMQIARLDSEVAMHEFVRQSESHLLEIARTYWALYAARVTYLQKQKLIDETARVTDELRARQKVDAQKAQLFRAESALADRRAALIRAEAAVRNAQDRLKALTSDPHLTGSAYIELIPRDRLVLSAKGTDVQSAAQAALANRPEIHQAFLQLRAATLRERMSKNELMPELNLVLKGSLGGLDNDYGGAYGREWNTGGPGYGAGLVFSFPIENQAARARHERRLIETRQQVNQLKTTIDTVLLEVKISAREVATAWRETQAKYAAVSAYAEDIASLEARRAMLAIDDNTQMGTYLDTLIDSQDRRASAEEDFIRAAANYQIALVNMERAKGKLLAYEDVHIVRDVDERGVPVLYLEKGGRGGKAVKGVQAK